MSQRAEQYANEFDQLSQEMMSTIESYSPEQMQARCEGEQCTVAALASHVAGVHSLGVDWIQRAAAGGPMPEITMDNVHAMNVEQFARDAKRSKDEILADLRENGAAASQAVRNLSDEDLDRTSHFALTGSEVTTEWVVQGILIGDIRGHLQSVKQAGGQA